MRVRPAVVSLLALVLPAVSAAGWAEDVPIEVRAVELRADDDSGTVELRTEEPVQWSVESSDRELVLYLPRTVPGPEALDRSSRAGLVSLVEVGFAVPEGVPTTRITIHLRKPFSQQVERTRGGLAVRFRTDQPSGGVAVQEQPAPESLENAPVARESSNAVLRENEELRQRVAELHQDRLELRASLENLRLEFDGRREAEALAASTELELARRDNEALRQKIAELDGQLMTLGESLTNAERALESRAHEQSATRAAELQRLADEKRALESRLEAARQETGRLTDEVADLEVELAETRGQDQSVALRERVSQGEEREAEISEQLRSSRDEVSALRAWLRRAPEILGARDFVVKPGSECLPLRPEPVPSSAVLTCLPTGAPVEALSLRPDWLRVRIADGKEGWVKSAGLISKPPDLSSERAELELARKEATDLKGRIGELEDRLQAASARSRSLEEQASDATGLAERLERERTARSSAEIELAASATRITELERDLSVMRQLETTSGEQADALAAARRETSDARSQAEATARKLKTLLAEVNFGGPRVARTADPCLALRAGPGTEHERRDCLVPGTPLVVNDSVSGWLAVTLDSGDAAGWVASAFVESADEREAADRTESLKRDLESSAVRVAALEQQLEQARATAEGQGGEARELAAELDRTRREAADRAAEIARLTGELDTTRSSAEETLANARGERADLAARVDASERRVRELTERLGASAESLEQGQQERSALEATLATERSETAALLERYRLVVKDTADPCLSMRLEPEVGSRSLECLPAGTVVRPLAAAGSWFRVRLADGRDGWSSGDYLESLEARSAAAGVAEMEAALERERSDHRAEIARTRDENAAAEERSVAFSAELSRMRSALDEREAAIAALEKRLEDGAALVAEGDRSADELAKERERLAGELEEAREGLAQAAERAGAIEAERAEESRVAQEVRARLAEELAIAGAEIDRLEALAASSDAIPGLEQELAESKAAREEAETQRTGIARSLAEREAELAAARSSLAESSASNENLTRRLTALESATETLTVERERASARAADAVRLEGELAAAEAALAESEATNQELATQLAALEASAQSLATEAERVSAQASNAARLEDELGTVRTSLAESEAANQDLVTRLTALEASAKSLATEKERASAQASNAARLEEELVAARAALAESRASARELERQLADVRSAAQRSADELGVVAAEKSDLASRLAELERVAQQAPSPAPVETARTAVEPSEPAQPPVSEAVVEESAVEPVPADLEAFARGWARAWSGQRVDDYLSFYAQSFVPPGGLNRSEWAAQRRQRLTAPEFIEVVVSDFETRISGPNRALVSFAQHYRSNTFEDRVIKKLELVREGELWKILEETAQ